MKNGKMLSFLIQSISILTVPLILVGCGEVQVPSAAGFSEQSEIVGTAGYTGPAEYELPTDMTSVIVNPEGYEIGFEKAAVFVGENIPGVFWVYDKNTGKTVYTGEIIPKENGTGQGYFSELETTGEYYIFCEGLGCSRYFTVTENRTGELTESLFSYLPGREDGSGNRKFDWTPDIEAGMDTSSVCNEVNLLLAAYEYYPQVFEAEEAYGEGGGDVLLEGLKETVSFLLTMQDETGGVYSGYGMQSSLMLREIGTEATLNYASALAKFGYLYQQKDWSFANTCLKSAVFAWQYLEKENASEVTEKMTASAFAAAAELYRATNDIKYHNYILLHREEIGKISRNLSFLQARSTYLLTRRKTDRTLSSELMETLLAEAREISETSKKELFTVRSEDLDNITLDMATMAVADYVITNREYAGVIQNYFHYLQGRNSTTGELQGDCTGVQLATLVLPLGAIQ